MDGGEQFGRRLLFPDSRATEKQEEEEEEQERIRQIIT
jgi:hypothetical protein